MNTYTKNLVGKKKKIKKSNNYNNLIVILVIHVRQKHVAYRGVMGSLLRQYFYMGDED